MDSLTQNASSIVNQHRQNDDVVDMDTPWIDYVENDGIRGGDDDNNDKNDDETMTIFVKQVGDIKMENLPENHQQLQQQQVTTTTNTNNDQIRSSSNHFLYNKQLTSGEYADKIIVLVDIQFKHNNVEICMAVPYMPVLYFRKYFRGGGGGAHHYHHRHRHQQQHCSIIDGPMCDDALLEHLPDNAVLVLRGENKMWELQRLWALNPKCKHRTFPPVKIFPYPFSTHFSYTSRKSSQSQQSRAVRNVFQMSQYYKIYLYLFKHRS